MTGSNSFWFANPSSGFYNGVATQSARFSDTNNKYLQRTDSTTPTSTQKFTFSCWLKNWSLNSGDTIFGSDKGTSGGPGDAGWIQFTTNRKLNIYNITSASYNLQWTSTAMYRDTTNWYHFVIRIDTTQASADDRVRLYVNGEQQAGSYSTTVGQNNNVAFNNAAGKFRIAGLGYADGYEGDFYLADVHHCDGYSYAPTEFAESKNGVWIAKNASVVYGNTGYRLEFKNSTVGSTSGSASTIGADTSGNAHHFNDYNMGTDDSNIPDSPENNFATSLGAGLAEPQDYQSYYQPTSSEGNLKVTGSSSGWTNGSSNFGMTSGKWYAELIVNSWVASNYVRIGLRARPARTYDEYFVLGNGTGQLDAAARNGRLASFSTGDVIQLALDLENNAFYLGKNNTWGNSATATEIANGTTTNAFASGSEVPTGDGHAYFFYAQPHSTGTSLTWNFGQDSSFAGAKTAQGNSDSGSSTTDFYYTPPDGFLACNTTNIPELTISPAQDTQADDHFNTVLYDANNQTAQSITGVGFQPDWMWFKQRSRGDSHAWIDTVRGIDKAFRLPVIDDEFDNSNSATLVTAVGADGFTLGTDAFAWVNYQSDTMVAWNWKAGGDITDVSGNFIKDGVAFTPTQGTIDATAISANTTSGFSIVTYTGSGSAGTVAHGLSVAPSMVIIKSRTGASVKNWVIGQDQSGFTGQMYFDTGVFSSNSGSFNNTAPTTSVVSIGTDQTTNGSGATYAMYCFANVEGYSKIGQYSGNSSSDGTFVYLGFRPAFLMIKTTSVSSQYWILRDNKRDAFNDDSNGSSLYANTQDSEGTGNIDIDFLSNGMKMRDNGNNTNGSGTYIYLAFAEQPFKFSNAR